MPYKVPMGRVFGIPIRVDLSWFLAVLLIGAGLSWQFARDLSPGDPIPPVFWAYGMMGALILFLCVLLHEMSHALVAKARGVPIRGITLFLFGGVSEMMEEPTDATQELLIASAGPLMSGVLAGVFYGLAQFAKTQGAGMEPVYFLSMLALLNVVLIAFNVLPGFPLDGGRLLRAAIWRFTGNLKRATYISTRIGVGLAVLMIAYGALVVLRGSFGGLWFALIGFFLKEAADQGYEQVLMRHAFEGVHVDQVMTTPPVTVPAEIPVETLVNSYFLQHRYKSFPVEEGGRLVGLVTLDDVKSVPREKWGEVAVVQIMGTDILEHCAEPEQEISKVLARMMQHGLGRIPVCLNGMPIGMLTRRDIMELFRVRTDLAE